MLSLSSEYRTLLLVQATKLFLSIGTRGYTSTIKPIKLEHDKLDALNSPVFGKDGKDIHEIAIQKDDDGMMFIAITPEWLDEATIERTDDLPTMLMSEFLIKDQDDKVLVRQACYPVYVLSWEKLRKGIIIEPISCI
jgi:hypothetical protein